MKSARVLLLAALLAASPLAAGPPATLADTGSPQVNVYPSSGTVDWAKASVFWFGRATEHDNYVDVRVGYNSQGLHVLATIVDYYLWYYSDGLGDPPGYDAMALYLDTGDSNLQTPGPGSFLLVSGFRGWPAGNDARWHRQARGNGTGWDYSWSPGTSWTDDIGQRYYNSGPNNNSDLDAGWTTTFTIPWASLGLSGPPPGGQSWKIGVQVHDRDDQPGIGGTATWAWPNGLQSLAPGTWAGLAFSPSPYRTPDLPVAGTTVIRQGLNGSIVSDTYAGGGGTCSGGVFGEGDEPHPGTTDLFVQNQNDVSDFPCFSKSYFKFDLATLPPGKTIISATLLLHEFGGSDPTQAYPSQVQLFSVASDWDETTLTWNNAPIAHENVSSTTVPVLPAYPGTPGVPNYWDATQPVAEAYAAGKAANMVLYSADTEYHSGKYFVSSNADDWNATGRPTLTITWAETPQTPSPTPTYVVPATPSPTPTPVPGATPTPTPTATSAPTPTPTSIPDATPTPKPAGTFTPTPGPTSTPSPVPSQALEFGLYMPVVTKSSNGW